MRKVSVAQVFPATVHQAERCWYDTARWPAWVDGLERVQGTTGDWPKVGSTVTWRSGPAGRGTVRERVSAHEPLAGQTVEVTDDSIFGHQNVAFAPADDGVEVVLSLEYTISRRTPFTPLVDLLFIRRAMEASLGRTLHGFGARLAHARSGDP
jgi:Polyketide cyclase / dehydrase and lipid transport